MFSALYRKDYFEIIEYLDSIHFYHEHIKYLLTNYCRYKKDVMKHLFLKSIDVNDIYGSNGETAMILLCQNIDSHTLELIDIFMEHGCDLDAQDYYKHTALYYAVNSKLELSVSVVEKLCCHLSDLNYTDDKGNNYLNVLALRIPQKLSYERDIRKCQILILYGCDPNHRNNENESAFDIALAINRKSRLLHLLRPVKPDVIINEFKIHVVKKEDPVWKEYVSLCEKQQIYFGSIQPWIFKTNEDSLFLFEIASTDKGEWVSGVVLLDVKSSFISIRYLVTQSDKNPSMKGAGTRIMNRILELGKSRKIYHFQLTPLDSSVEFYKRFGFVFEKSERMMKLFLKR